MKRTKSLSVSSNFSLNDLENYADNWWNDQVQKQQKANLRRWRRLKQQLI